MFLMMTGSSGGVAALRGRALASVLFLALGTAAGFAAPLASDSYIRGGPFALAPPLVAIGMAVIWRRILPALLAGIYGGALLLSGGNPALAAWQTVSEFVGPTAWAPDNLFLFAFTLSLMGMVGILIRGGGIDGLVRLIARLARGRRSTQAVIGAMGTAVFFDDYANAVVVGTSARGISDQALLSREKLAYIVDSTAAPVASLAIISTWIGIEIGLLDKQMEHLSSIAQSGYGVFISLIPLRFYCLLTLITVGVVALTGRDFGPMLAAERRARGGQVSRPGARLLSSKAFERLAVKAGVVGQPLNGLLPILSVLAFIMGSFFLAGAASPALAGRSVSPLSLTDWRDCFTSVSNSGLWLASSGVVGSLVAFALAVGRGQLTVREAAGAWANGAASMAGAVALLILAMTLRKVTDGEHLALAEYLLAFLTQAHSLLIPLLVFIVASIVAVCTGTSYGTMGILIPVAVPLAAAAGEPAILLLATGAVLDGAVFGDHCSPISDTTVLSSIGAGCDHLDHVRTQWPYAVLTMVAAALFGYLLLPLSGVSAAWGLAGGGAAILVVFLLVGRSAGR